MITEVYTPGSPSEARETNLGMEGLLIRAAPMRKPIPRRRAHLQLSR